jgi:hypothetical protein
LLSPLARGTVDSRFLLNPADVGLCCGKVDSTSHWFSS